MSDANVIERKIAEADEGIQEQDNKVAWLADELYAAEIELRRRKRDRQRLYLLLAAAKGDGKRFVTYDGIRVGTGDSVYSKRHGEPNEYIKFDIHDDSIGREHESGGYSHVYYHGEEGFYLMADRVEGYYSDPESGRLEDFAHFLGALTEARRQEAKP